MKIGRAPKGNDRIPSINFFRCENVSFREGKTTFVVEQQKMVCQVINCQLPQDLDRYGARAELYLPGEAASQGKTLG